MQGRLTEAQQYYEKDLQIAKQLAEETGTVEARRDLSISYNKLGGICEAQGTLPEAQQYYEKSLHIREQLAEENGTVQAWDDMAVSHYYLGCIAEDAAEQNAHLSQAYHIWKLLAEQCPDNPEFARRRDIVKRILETL